MSFKRENKTRPPLCYFYVAQFSSEVLVGTSKRKSSNKNNKGNLTVKTEVKLSQFNSEPKVQGKKIFVMRFDNGPHRYDTRSRASKRLK